MTDDRISGEITMLEYLKDVYPDLQRITSVVQDNPEMFGIPYGQSCMKIAADYLEKRALIRCCPYCGEDNFKAAMPERFWKRTVHLSATITWAWAVFGPKLVNPIYRGNDWLPTIWNQLNECWIELKLGATRQQMLDVWEAIGGHAIQDRVLHAACEIDRLERTKKQ